MTTNNQQITTVLPETNTTTDKVNDYSTTAKGNSGKFPIILDFEKRGLNEIGNTTTNNGQWLIVRASKHFGPELDHTTNERSGHYLSLAGAESYRKATIEFNFEIKEKTEVCLSFVYSMPGDSVKSDGYIKILSVERAHKYKKSHILHSILPSHTTGWNYHYVPLK